MIEKFDQYLLTHFDTNDEEVKDIHLLMVMSVIAILGIADSVFKIINFGG